MIIIIMSPAQIIKIVTMIITTIIISIPCPNHYNGDNDANATTRIMLPVRTKNIWYLLDQMVTMMTTMMMMVED